MSACGIAMLSIRGPLEPIMIGVRRAGGGSRTASSARWYVPSSVTRSPASRPRMIANASSKRLTRRSYGIPKASNSRRFQPAPSPSTKRPWLTSSIVAAIFAIRPGGWKPAQATSGPSRTVLVTAASALSSVHASHGARSGAS